MLDKVGMSYEIVLVEDGSPDESWARLVVAAKAGPDHLVAVQLMRNDGLDNALMCGFRHARGPLIVTMPDDLQHPPEEIPKLLDTIGAAIWTWCTAATTRRSTRR